MLAVVLEATSRGVVTYAYPIAVRFCQSVLKQVHGLQSKHEKSQEPRVMLKKNFDTIQKSVFLVIDLGGRYIIQSITFMNRSLAELGSPALPVVTVIYTDIVISPHGDGDLLVRGEIPCLGIVVHMHNIMQGISHPSGFVHSCNYRIWKSPNPACLMQNNSRALAEHLHQLNSTQTSTDVVTTSAWG